MISPNTWFSLKVADVSQCDIENDRWENDDLNEYCKKELYKFYATFLINISIGTLSIKLLHDKLPITSNIELYLTHFLRDTNVASESV